LESGAHDFGDAAPNTTHEASDNTNSKVERPWTLTMNTPELLDDYNILRLLLTHRGDRFKVADMPMLKGVFSSRFP
jgi:hypothetical protein